MATEAQIRAGVRRLAERFGATRTAPDHFAILDPRGREQVMWIRTNRKDLWAELRPAIVASWDRVYPEGRLLKAAAADSVNVVRRGCYDENRKGPQDSHRVAENRPGRVGQLGL